MPMPIGTLARQAGVKVPTIRYYEQVGLLPEPDRTGSNRRAYGEETLERLRFIRHARELGFDVEAIRQLLALAAHPEEPCEAVDDLARAHLADIDSKIARLTALRAEVQRMLDHGTHGHIGECRVIEVLGDHGHCAAEAH